MAARAWLLLAAALVLAIVASSATLRQAAAAGLPAAPWQEGVRLAHRVSASAAGLVFLFGVLLSWPGWGRGERVAGALLLCCTALLAVVGRYTVAGAALPVVLVNLLGGHALLGLLAWLWVRPKTDIATLLPAFALLLLDAQGAAQGASNLHAASGVLMFAWPVLMLRRQGASPSRAPRLLIGFLGLAAVVGVLMRTAGGGLAAAVLHSLLAAFALAAAASLSRRA